ncbi:LuxR C-terminal-related transcriptional regulator [Dyadobacter aurulentus]|uniref:LuxR C-terminal-related transcriptional regulator n=1 Tax=Dyadobacter sp. UC 10 TaxID=2605428 RepID=UPI0011F27A53|nr:response regulator transcription factor [Dyadobacter sp. UC 10]KAA0992043.1 response regulator transcription factor [Dyadobacter sp. UC 10]
MKLIAIVDIYPIVRVGLRQFVADNFNDFLMIESDNISQFAGINIDRTPDLFIIGNTKELFNSACNTIKKILKKSKTANVILFDDSPNHLRIIRAFKAGAKGYLSKHSDIDELVKSVSNVSEGRFYICPDALHMILPSYNPTSFISRGGGNWLSSRDYDIANLLASGYTLSSISRKMDISVATVRRARSRIFKKLNIVKIEELNDSLRKYSLKVFEN